MLLTTYGSYSLTTIVFNLYSLLLYTLNPSVEVGLFVGILRVQGFRNVGCIDLSRPTAFQAIDGSAMTEVKLEVLVLGLETVQGSGFWDLRSEGV